MDVSKIVAEMDAELERLSVARAALLQIEGMSALASIAKRRGRPKGSGNAPKAAQKARTLSVEGRKRIAEAMKKWWAERRKVAPKNEVAK